MLNASHVRTNRAAFSAALMSRVPAIAIGWFATTPPTGCPLDVAEPDDDVLRVQRLDLEQDPPLVEDVLDHRAHVVRLGVGVGDERVELLVLRRDRQVRVVRVGRRVREVVGRQVPEQRADVVERVVLVGRHVVRDARAGAVRRRAAELLEAHVLAGHRADDVRARDEHVRRAVRHDDEVRQRGGSTPHHRPTGRG